MTVRWGVRRPPADMAGGVTISFCVFEISVTGVVDDELGVDEKGGIVISVFDAFSAASLRSLSARDRSKYSLYSSMDF